MGKEMAWVGQPRTNYYLTTYSGGFSPQSDKVFTTLFSCIYQPNFSPRIQCGGKRIKGGKGNCGAMQCECGVGARRGVKSVVG